MKRASCGPLVLGVPIVSVSIDPPHMHRARYRAPHDLGLETMVTLCLSGPSAEELFFGSIEMAVIKATMRWRASTCRVILIRSHAAAELARYRDAAQRLVCSAWAMRHIRLLAGALMQHDTLTGEEISGCVLAPPA